MHLVLLDNAMDSDSSNMHGARTSCAYFTAHSDIVQPSYGSDNSVTTLQVRQRLIKIHVVDKRYKQPSWMHPNIGGEATHMPNAFAEDLDRIREKMHGRPKLSEWLSTAIGGNDILSSVLFTAGLTTSKAGYLAPVVQIVVVVVIYCFRWILEEVCSAVPLNGGSYAALLNAVSKRTAAVAAVCSILSYLATGVVCAVSAINYLNYLVEVPVVPCTIAMLFIFAVLCFIGISESARVALIIFLLHALTLSILCLAATVYCIQHPSILHENLKVPLPKVTIFSNEQKESIWTAIIFGYAPAFLSVTGFESSAQFIQEQAHGVFPKTLRNMWAISSFFNVALSILSIAAVPMEILISKSEVLLAYMGGVTAGRWLEVFVSLDACIVLAGAVLTSYVGIIGLCEQLALDRLMPSFLLKRNSCRDTHHFIIFGYFVVASGWVLIFHGDITILSGVFACAFLGVMISFAVACLFLRIYRSHMLHGKTSWKNTIFCLAMGIFGFVSNALSDYKAVMYSLVFFFVILGIIWLMLHRIRVLQSLLYVSKEWQLTRSRSETFTPHRIALSGISVRIAKTIEAIKKTPIIFFCKAAVLPKLNEAVSYVIKNEQTYSLHLLHLISEEEDAPGIRENFGDVVCLFDHIYPTMKIDFCSMYGSFDPTTVAYVAEIYSVPVNSMFMRQPRHEHSRLVSYAGVRVIE